ncbi:MAG: HupE/UreJ family protein [Candidatus Nitronauta litoralis]|uniref:HupE/UreJ family protein n=1 Tax=Candidatus Nitronauta litoralis TaxID=2705533 RepID=A0A7T0FZT3_9BACT|nr:MAG: HupE/UreJ family protein [Candidatus Nitronauta litoralis]
MQQLPLGDEGIILRILLFNFGIKLGQIGELCILLALLYKWRRAKSFLQISFASNHAITAAGVFFFLMQMHGYEHTMNPDEFGFPEENHFHAHEAMDVVTPTTPLPGSEYLVDPE